MEATLPTLFTVRRVLQGVDPFAPLTDDLKN